jgi:hypothetical protein
MIFGCKHRELSRLVTLQGRTYQACLECGAELEYDLETMRPTGRLIEHAIAHPDRVAIARRKQLPAASCQLSERERTQQC